jgi:hypothetical protein
LIADEADGEGMGGELVDGGDGGEEVLSGSPWSTFWGENGEMDCLAEKCDVVVTFGRGHNVKVSRVTGMREPLRDWKNILSLEPWFRTQETHILRTRKLTNSPSFLTTLPFTLASKLSAAGSKYTKMFSLLSSLLEVGW